MAVAAITLGLCLLFLLETADLHERTSGQAARLISLAQAAVLVVSVAISLLALALG